MEATEPIDISPSLSKFAVSLFKVISKSLGPSSNVCISPFSIATVISMVHVGARGDSAEQIKNVLHFNEFEDDKASCAVGRLCNDMKSDKCYTLELANQMYVANNFQLAKHFQASMNNHFGAPAESVNFFADETRININKWVEDFTHQKIKDLIPPGFLPGTTRLTLVNAVYFNGDWKNAFDESDTKIKPFYLGFKNIKTNVNMMHKNGDFNTGFISSLNARVLELPYMGRRLSMFIVLPNQVDGLPCLETNLPENFFELIDNESSNAKLDVVIPKFKVETTVKIREALIEMGITDIFEPDKADLSGITGTENLFVSDGFHKAFIDVNEKGSEAAAATALVLRCLSAEPVSPPPPFIADHPFIYSIRDNWTGTILFIGKLDSPSKNENNNN